MSNVKTGLKATFCQDTNKRDCAGILKIKGDVSTIKMDRIKISCSSHEECCRTFNMLIQRSDEEAFIWLHCDFILELKWSPSQKNA